MGGVGHIRDSSRMIMGSRTGNAVSRAVPRTDLADPVHGGRVRVRAGRRGCLAVWGQRANAVQCVVGPIAGAAPTLMEAGLAELLGRVARHGSFFLFLAKVSRVARESLTTFSRPCCTYPPAHIPLPLMPIAALQAPHI